MARAFGWGWTKGRKPATRITVTHVVNVDDMFHILCGYAETDYRIFKSELTTPQLERVIREHMGRHGESGREDGWDEGTNERIRNLIRLWAQTQLRQAFPEQCGNRSWL